MPYMLPSARLEALHRLVSPKQNREAERDCRLASFEEEVKHGLGCNLSPRGHPLSNYLQDLSIPASWQLMKMKPFTLKLPLGLGNGKKRPDSPPRDPCCLAKQGQHNKGDR